MKAVQLKQEPKHFAMRRPSRPLVTFNHYRRLNWGTVVRIMTSWEFAELKT